MGSAQTQQGRDNVQRGKQLKILRTGERHQFSDSKITMTPNRISKTKPTPRQIVGKLHRTRNRDTTSNQRERQIAQKGQRLGSQQILTSK